MNVRCTLCGSDVDLDSYESMDELCEVHECPYSYKIVEGPERADLPVDSYMRGSYGFDDYSEE